MTDEAKNKLACVICGLKKCNQKHKPDTGHCEIDLEQADRVLAFLATPEGRKMMEEMGK